MSSKSAEERIADALEEQNEIRMGIIKGIGIGTLVVLGFFILLFGGSSIYNFFYYDVFGNESPFAVAVGVPMSQEAIEKEYRINYMGEALGLDKPYPPYQELESMYQLSISHVISGQEDIGTRAKAVVDGNNFYWLIKYENGTFDRFQGSYDDLIENYELEAVMLP